MANEPAPPAAEWKLSVQLCEVLAQIVTGKIVSTGTNEGSATVTALYFGGEWCAACRRFVPILASAYHRALKGKGLEIVYISRDEDEPAFNAYFKTMPWRAVPFANQQLRYALDAKFEVNTYPAMVLIGEDGGVISRSGCSDVEADPSGNLFPWRPPAFVDLAESTVHRGTDLMDPFDWAEKVPSLVVLCESASAAERQDAEKALTTVAKRVNRTREEVGLFLSAHMCPEGQILRKLVGLEDDGRPQLLLLDWPSGRYFQLTTGGVQCRPHSFTAIWSFITSCKKGNANSRICKYHGGVLKPGGLMRIGDGMAELAPDTLLVNGHLDELYNGVYSRQTGLWNGKAHYENTRGMQLYYYDANRGGSCGWSFDDRRQVGHKCSLVHLPLVLILVRQGADCGSRDWCSGGWVQTIGGPAYPPLSEALEMTDMRPVVRLQPLVNMNLLATAEARVLDQMANELSEDDDESADGERSNPKSPRLNASQRGFWQSTTSKPPLQFLVMSHPLGVYDGVYTQLEGSWWNGRPRYKNETGMQFYFYNASNAGGCSSWSFDSRTQVRLRTSNPRVSPATPASCILTQCTHANSSCRNQKAPKTGVTAAGSKLPTLIVRAHSPQRGLA
jgi:nucleoredoxin